MLKQVSYETSYHLPLRNYNRYKYKRIIGIKESNSFSHQTSSFRKQTFTFSKSTKQPLAKDI